MKKHQKNKKIHQTKKKKKIVRRSSQGLRISNLEKDYLQNHSSIIGIDEVGRGCMAGPLVVTGFKINIDHTPVKFVHDSKIVPKKIREVIYPQLTINKHFIHQSSNQEIDNDGLTKSFKNGVLEIVNSLSDENSIVIVDGNLKFTEFENIHSIVDADALLYCVAAASIIAKVYRDNLMVEYSKIYPQYGFDRHVGYATKKHREAVKTHGVLDIHRKSYKFIRELPEISDQSTLF